MRGIIASRIYKNKLQYKVDWKGYNANKAFYNAKGFKGCPYKLYQFHRDNPQVTGPPKRLEEWLRAWENGKPINAHIDNNAPTKQPARLKRRQYYRF